jgi:hypothetical protein
VLDDGSVLISDPVQARRARFSLSAPHAVFESQVPMATEQQIMAAGQEKRDKVKIINGTTATVHRTFGDGSSSDLQVTLQDKRGLTLVSTSSLGTDLDGNTYVVLEVAKPSTIVHVERSIRKYNRRGLLTSNISAVPPQQEIAPTTEFQVKNGVVYQMIVKVDGVVINRWDTHRKN